MRVLRYVSLAVWLFAGAQVNGQFQSKSNAQEFRGRLVEGAGISYEGYVVEIANVADRSNTQRVDVLSDGTFVFHSVNDGDYMIKVVTLYGAEITSAVATIGPGSTGQIFEIRMAGAKVQRPVTGTVSLQQLSHPVSKPMRKLLDSGQKFLDEKRFSDAAARYREALRIDPQSAEAHAQLALALSRTEAWDGAIEEYRAATALDPGNAVLHSNLSAVLASANRFDEAESEASAALKLDPRNPRAHYVMAGALLKTHGNLQDVVANLAAARDSFPSARTALEKICAVKSVTGARKQPLSVIRHPFENHAT